MNNNIYGIGWYLRRTYNARAASEFYLRYLKIPVIRIHNENIVHWCGNASVVGFNQINKDVKLITPNQSNNVILLFKLKSKKQFADKFNFIEQTKDIPNIPSITFYKDNEGIIFGIKEPSRQQPDYFDQYWNKKRIPQQLDEEFALKENQLGLSSIIIRSKNWIQNAEFYQRNLNLSIISESKESIELAIDEFSTINFIPGKNIQKTVSSRLSSRQSFVFRCKNINSIAKKLRYNGFTPINRHITEDQSGKIYYFHDLSGQVFGIQSRTKSTRIEDLYAERKYSL